MYRLGILILLIVSVSSLAHGQTQPGTISIGGKLAFGKEERPSMARKRFYLFDGGLAENKGLIDRIHAAKPQSRDCFYAGLKASACLVDWLRAQNCESVFCRTVTQEDVGRVPEFKAAYDRGIGLYGARPELALSWVISNMSQTLAAGFYDSQLTLLTKLLGDKKPLQNTMTTITVAQASFPGLTAGKKYTVSNVIPVEVKGKGYTWTCERTVEAAATATINLSISDKNKLKGCDLWVQDLPQCNTGTCGKM